MQPLLKVEITGFLQRNRAWCFMLGCSDVTLCDITLSQLKDEKPTLIFFFGWLTTAGVTVTWAEVKNIILKGFDGVCRFTDADIMLPLWISNFSNTFSGSRINIFSPKADWSQKQKCVCGVTFYEEFVLLGIKSKDRMAVCGHQMSWGKNKEAQCRFVDDVLEEHLSISLYHKWLVTTRKNKKTTYCNFCRNYFFYNELCLYWCYYIISGTVYQALQWWHWHSESRDGSAVFRPGQRKE